jgi:magnesium transporter
VAQTRTTVQPGAGGGVPFDWVDITDPGPDDAAALASDPDVGPELAAHLDRPARRPFLLLVDDAAVAVVKTAVWDEHGKSLRHSEIRLLVRAGAVVTADHGTGLVAKVRAELARRPDLAPVGPEVVLALVVGYAVRSFGPVLNELGDAVTDVEAGLFTDTRERPTRRIYRLSHEVLELRRMLGPLPDMIDQLPVLGDEQPKALRRILNQDRTHAERLVDSTDGLNNQLTNALQANLTEVSVQQNDDMRKISSYAALLGVPTVVAGIYGMNFEHMPELDWTFGYPAALLLMAVLVTGLWRVFHRTGWL